MSKRHIVVLKISSGWKVANNEEIWKNVKDVWGQYPSPAITRGHIIAYHLMHKSLDMDGGNEYLGNGLHYNVRQDFINNDDGMALVDHI